MIYSSGYAPGGEDLGPADQHSDDNGGGGLHPQAEGHRPDNIRHLPAHILIQSQSSFASRLVPDMSAGSVRFEDRVFCYIKSPAGPAHPHHGG